jgi:hypothetical protein
MTPVAKVRPQLADRPPHRIGSAGSPPFRPTADNKALVKAMAGLKLTQAEIAAAIVNPHTERPISIETLRKYFRPELEAGWATLKSLVTRRYIEALNAGQVWAIQAGLRQLFGWRNSGHIIPLEAAPAAAQEDDDRIIRDFERILAGIRAAAATEAIEDSATELPQDQTASDKPAADKPSGQVVPLTPRRSA